MENVSLRARLRREDGIRRQRFLSELLTVYEKWVAGRIDLDEVVTITGEVVDAYAASALAEIAALTPDLARLAGESWLTTHVRDGLRALGVAVRDAILDPTARHTVAQVLQARILHAELEARRVIASHAEPAPRRPESDQQR